MGERSVVSPARFGNSIAQIPSSPAPRAVYYLTPQSSSSVFADMRD